MPVLGIAPGSVLGLVLAVAESSGPPAPAPLPGSSDGSGTVTTSAPAQAPRAPKVRRWMVGIEATALQVPVLRPRHLTLDPRFTGGSTPLGGAGVFGRFRPTPLVAVDLAFRSGSGRYRDDTTSDIISSLLLSSEASVFLYLARGDVAQFALEGGVGGIYNRAKYEVGDAEGIQAWGSGFVRMGADAEFLVKRLAFVLALRGYGVFTDTSRVTNKGDMFSGHRQIRAPVTTYQTYVSVTGGLAYRF